MSRPEPRPLFFFFLSAYLCILSPEDTRSPLLLISFLIDFNHHGSLDPLAVHLMIVYIAYINACLQVKIDLFHCQVVLQVHHHSIALNVCIANLIEREFVCTLNTICCQKASIQRGLTPIHVKNEIDAKR